MPGDLTPEQQARQVEFDRWLVTRQPVEPGFDVDVAMADLAIPHWPVTFFDDDDEYGITAPQTTAVQDLMR